LSRATRRIKKSN